MHVSVQRLGTILEGLVRARGWRARLERQRALTLWPKVVGPELARRTVPLRVEGDTLVIAVRDDAWATQLGFLRTEILRRLQAQCGPSLRELRFTSAWPPQLRPQASDPSGGQGLADAPDAGQASAACRRPAGQGGVQSGLAAWREAAARRAAAAGGKGDAGCG